MAQRGHKLTGGASTVSAGLAPFLLVDISNEG